VDPQTPAPPAPGPGGPSELDRREVLRYLGMLTLAGAAAPSFVLEACRRSRETPRTPPEDGAAGKGRSLTAAEWRTTAAWTDTLLPSAPGSPGAKDVNATGYFDAVLADLDVSPADQALVKAALPRLDALAHEVRDADFADLNPEDRDAVLARLRDGPDGYRTLWLGLAFTVEALLGDPVYGANKDGVGWKFIHYPPPQPRPEAPQGSFPR
jgi:Gluconate 2-dehydrogenase subunit 3